MRILRLAGDWAPLQREVASIHWEAPYVMNLEAPISSETANVPKRRKAGPYLWNRPLPLTYQPKLVTLANNHIMDFGIDGLKTTLAVLRDKGIGFAGAGMDLTAAQAPVFLELDGTRIALLSRAEVQFGTATEKTPGVAPFDSTIYEDIRNLKQEADIVIVSVHAASELCPWPSPQRQDSFRALIDAGADIVHGHHSHVPQGWEIYNGKYIFYGLGNFCVDPAKWSRIPNALWSLVPEVMFDNGQIYVKIDTAVIENNRDTIEVRPSSLDERNLQNEYLEVCNAPLQDRQMLDALWQEASVRMYESFYCSWLGFRRNRAGFLPFLRRLASVSVSSLRRLARTQLAYEQERNRNLLRYHLFACESHRDAISTALGVLSGELNDRRTTETARLVCKHMSI